MMWLRLIRLIFFWLFVGIGLIVNTFLVSAFLIVLLHLLFYGEGQVLPQVIPVIVVVLVWFLHTIALPKYVLPRNLAALAIFTWLPVLIGVITSFFVPFAHFYGLVAASVILAYHLAVIAERNHVSTSEQ